MSTALAALRAGAARGMREDCAPEDGRARETLLQLYRKAQAANGHFRIGAQPGPDDPYSTDDLAALEWIAALAQSGHAGAAGLLERSLSVEWLAGGDPERADYALRRLEAWLGGLFRASPERVASLVARVPDGALLPAIFELGGDAPYSAALVGYLERVSAATWVAAVLRETDAADCVPSARERRWVRDLLFSIATDMTFVDGGVPVREGELAARLATFRLASALPADRAAGERCMAYAEAKGVKAEFLRLCRDDAVKLAALGRS